MSSAPKAVAIILGATIALYLVIFLISVPAMSSRVPMARAMGTNIYAAMYRPVRDLLPPDNFVRGLWQDYEAYWCGGSRSCEL